MRILMKILVAAALGVIVFTIVTRLVEGDQAVPVAWWATITAVVTTLITPSRRGSCCCVFKRHTPARVEAIEPRI